MPSVPKDLRKIRNLSTAVNGCKLQVSFDPFGLSEELKMAYKTRQQLSLICFQLFRSTERKSLLDYEVLIM
jgi:hypothetical protein